MSIDNVIGIDLAKNSFHVCAVSKQNKIMTDRSFTKTKLKAWLLKQPQSLVVLEACGSAHHWARWLLSINQKVVLLSPKTVTPFRQGHKTDQTDARAIAIAAVQPGIKTVAIKNIEQQGLQSIARIREHWRDHITATSNLIRGLLYEFGITIPKGHAPLMRRIPEILEDAENDLPDVFRYQLAELFHHYQQHRDNLVKVEKSLFSLIKSQPECQKLMALEGVSHVNALGLYLSLGENGSSFKNGREAAACIGLTPKQYSTGGVVRMAGIGKKSGNKKVRANLIQGALAVVITLAKRPPRNTKESWLASLIERKGKRRAAVALANKTVRTAWAMLHYQTEYQAPITEAV